MNPRIPFLPLPLLAALATVAAAQSPFTIGDLVVVTVNSASTTSAISLDEYTTAGVFVQSILLPAAASGSNRQITIRGDAASEGYLNVSTNGLYLTLTGYDAPVSTSTATIQASTAATINRVLCRVDLNGAVDTSTALTDAYDGSTSFQANVRAAASVDGQSFWISGTGLASSGGMPSATRRAVISFT